MGGSEWAPLGADYVPPQPAPVSAPVNHADAIYTLYRKQDPDEPCLYYECDETTDTVALCAQLAASKKFAPDTQFTPTGTHKVRISLGAERLCAEEHDAWVARTILYAQPETTEKPPVTRATWIVCAMVLAMLAAIAAGPFLYSAMSARCRDHESDPDERAGMRVLAIGDTTIYRAEDYASEPLATVCANLDAALVAACLAYGFCIVVAVAVASRRWGSLNQEAMRRCVRAWAQRVIAARTEV